MGGKPSKTPKVELSRSKSLSSFGRSSQRSLFLKSNAKLNQINKQLQKYEKKGEPAVLDELKQQLDRVEKDLNDISEAIKEKNKQKYEDILKYFEETRQKIEDQVKLTVELNSNIPADQEAPKSDNVQQQAELNVVKVVSAEEPDVELRNPPVNVDNEEQMEQPRSPKVKFGIQVMPVNPRVSQELLKRKTLPLNEVPKSEFLHIRRNAESDGNYRTVDNELYNHHLPNEVKEENRPTSFTQNNELYELNSNLVHPASLPSSPKSVNKPLKKLEKRQVNASALQKVEAIAADVDVLEDRLKYFHGTKGDSEYLVLHGRFVKNLVKLDNVEAQDDPVVRQERKILIYRIQELIKILECLVKQPDGIQEPYVDEDSVYDYMENRQEEVVNAEGKPVTATAL